MPGADLFEIRKMDRAGTERFLAEGQAVFDRISKLPMPTVAAINGDCLGGGFELALACTYRVAADDGSINIGLPEVKLGILPGWGGTVRLPRRIGLAQRACPCCWPARRCRRARRRRPGSSTKSCGPKHCWPRPSAWSPRTPASAGRRACTA